MSNGNSNKNNGNNDNQKNNESSETKVAPAKPEVEVFQPNKFIPQAFQSDSARTAAQRTQAINNGEDELVDGEIQSDARSGVLAADGEDMSMYQKVVVRPRKTIPRLRIGQSWFQLVENQKTVVPKHVAKILEQKGVL